jgi:hypothetical protein
VIVETLVLPSLTDRPPAKVRRALLDREIQSFDKRRVEFRVLRLLQRLFQPPPVPKHRSSLHLHDAIVSACLDHPTIKIRWTKNSSDDLLVKPESIRMSASCTDNNQIGTVYALDAAKKEIQFTTSVETMKKALPGSLLVLGHNPLKLLHTCLSDGMHDQTDEKCFQIATKIRTVLNKLVERITLARQEQTEFKTAVSRLLNRSAQNKTKPPTENE